MKILALLVAVTAPTFAEYLTTYVNGRPVTVRMNTCGNSVRTSGTVNGSYVNTYTTNYGNSSYSTGQVGGQNYYNYSSQIGNYRYSNGSLGGYNYNSTSYPIGNTYYTKRPLHAPLVSPGRAVSRCMGGSARNGCL